MALANMVLADVSLAGLVWWLVVGLIAGFLASLVMRGGGYGIAGDIIVGIVGAFIGGFLASLLGIGAGGLIGTRHRGRWFNWDDHHRLHWRVYPDCHSSPGGRQLRTPAYPAVKEARSGGTAQSSRPVFLCA